jgi:alkanesulfonate monooxygenase SsuD/methylene tetrahydromethanopterin reductase-like flavin-dependent oxidoreductase (luciferase family)
MREYLAVLPGLLAGDSVSHRGEDFRIAAQLDPCGAPAPPVLLAALGPKMLQLAGRSADGVALWLGGERFIGEFAFARIDAGASAAGRPRPRVIVGLPVAVTKHAAARDAAEKFLALSSRMPAYRRVLEREGAESPADAALVGDENHVLRRLEALEKLGVSDFNAILFPVRGDPRTIQRTRDVLADFAKGRG